jgi:L-threonylcarbamoyladenylate synthase
VSETPDAEPAFQRFDCTVDDPEAIEAAIEAARVAIENGECIVLPTDTVYGIGADAFSPEAVQRLLDAKIRGRDMPPPVLIADPALIRALADDVPQQAKDLVARYWPGALTVILRAQPSLRMDLGDAEGTIALRVPDHELARDILRRTGPMAVSSANISGLAATLTCDEAMEQLYDRVGVYLDGGRLGEPGNSASTIVDFTQTASGAILRRGALSIAAIREVCPDVVDLDDPEEPEDDTAPSDAAETEAGEGDAGGAPSDAAETEAGEGDAGGAPSDSTDEHSAALSERAPER